MSFNLADDTAELASLVASAQSELTAIMFPSRCDVWSLGMPTLDADKVLQDATWGTSGTNILCRLLPTPEANSPEELGRARTDNLETLDQFHFQSGFALSDGDIIIFRTVGDNFNRIWIVQGNPKSMTPDPFRPLSYQLVLATNTTTVPAGVTI